MGRRHRALDEIQRVLHWQEVLFVQTPAGERGWRVGWLFPKPKGPFAVISGITPPEFEPRYVPIPSSFDLATARSVARLAPYWNGFRDGVAEVYAVVRDDLESPPTPAGPASDERPLA